MTDRVIFWDFEGTLAIRRGRWPAALAAVVEEHAPSVAVPAEKLLPLLSHGFPWRHPEVPHPELSDPDAWWAHMRPTFVRIYCQAGLDPALAERLASEVRASYLRFDQWKLYEDTLPALEALTAAGWRQTVVSNHVPELPQVVRALGLDRFIEEVISSACVGYEKPRPEIYRLALERSKYPGTRWMVGDNPINDVLAAEKAGIPGILVRTKDERAARSFDDLSAVTHFLARDP